MGVDWRWLKGDLHCHCERPELLEAMLEHVDQRLDFLAVTNHPHKPIMEQQADLIARARKLLPNLPVFYGFEWNGIGGRHTNVIFPPSPREASHALEFIRRHDHHVTGREPDIPAALGHLAALPEKERPIVFINHPSQEIAFDTAHLDAIRKADTANLFVGAEALHGHQAWPKVIAMDPHSYPSSMVGGLCDHEYTQHQPFALLAHSDFHVHKQESKPDYPLGVFNHSLLAVDTTVVPANAIFNALRTGHSCAAQGSWFQLRAFQIGHSRMGQHASTHMPVTLRMEAEIREPLRTLELIGQLTPHQPPTVLKIVGTRPEGLLRMEFIIPQNAQGFIRLRATSATLHRPPPGKPAPKLFLSSAILFGPE